MSLSANTNPRQTMLSTHDHQGVAPHTITLGLA